MKFVTVKNYLSKIVKNYLTFTVTNQCLVHQEIHLMIYLLLGGFLCERVIAC